MERNLQYRQKILESAGTDLDLQQDLWTACSRDVLFYINAFVWTYDPRKTVNPRLPFITYEYQDEAFIALNESIGKHDVLIEKSRDMGASWICLTLFQWLWMFHPNLSFLMVSRKESLVDGASDSLFAHIDFIHKHLPVWMRPRYRRNKLKLINEDNGSRIEGESTTDNIGRGGRRTAMLVDEFAAFEQGGYDVLSATADNTTCRIFNSTPHGTANAFYAQRQRGTARLRFHWPDHPEKGEGLYTDEKGKPRSPWYDRECTRRAHEVEIATQLDIDYQGSDYPFFDPATLDQLKMEFCRPASHQGSLIVEEGHDPIFVDDGEGFLKLWCDLDEEMKPRGDRDYVVGCDISQGTRASDSVLTVGDRLSGEKVAEWSDNTTSATRLAEIAVGLCRMFTGAGGRPAFLIWEATGPGRTFGKKIIEDLHYGHIFYHVDDKTAKKKPTDRPGWFSSGDAKKDLLMNYRDALFSKRFINPSEKAIDEAGEYVYLANGKIEHGGSINSIDPTNRGTGHGDRVIADALCAKILHERRVEPEVSIKSPDVMSFQWRRDQRDQQDVERLEWN